MAHSNLKLESVNEDSVQCFFFSSSPENNIMFWKDLCEKINQSIKVMSAGYLWHKDEFKVHVPICNWEKNDVPVHLISTTCFSDNIEDEWFIVYLVLQITKQFENLIVQIMDNDGDFLLIEAAEYLPSWANPETTTNRTFIYKNRIHIIPPSIVDCNINLTLNNAINFVVNLSKETEASSDIQQIILKRINSYPEKIKENIHHAIVKLPVDVATLLTLKPSFIAPIVNAYCNFDIIDAKSCRSISFENCINVEVKFTKCLYAMLVHSKLIKNIKYENKAKNDKKSILGLKLNCGYQMIMNKSSADVFASKKYNNFLNNLKVNGYFKENIEGSKDYKQLLEQAKQFFFSIECPINSHICHEICQTMLTKEFIDLKETLILRNKSEIKLTEDNEDWLNIYPEQLNDLLNTRYGKQIKFKNNDVVTVETITSRLSNFLRETSDFEGIEPNRVSVSENNKIEFDPDEFVNSLQKMLNLISSENHGKEDIETDFNSDDSEDECMTQDTIIDSLDRELSTKLQNAQIDQKDNKTDIHNILQSIKEEQLSGPSSTLLRSIGINKSDLLDSDDEIL